MYARKACMHLLNFCMFARVYSHCANTRVPCSALCQPGTPPKAEVHVAEDKVVEGQSATLHGLSKATLLRDMMRCCFKKVLRMA